MNTNGSACFSRHANQVTENRCCGSLGKAQPYRCAGKIARPAAIASPYRFLDVLHASNFMSFPDRMEEMPRDDRIVQGHGIWNILGFFRRSRAFPRANIWELFRNWGLYRKKGMGHIYGNTLFFYGIKYSEIWKRVCSLKEWSLWINYMNWKLIK